MNLQLNDARSDQVLSLANRLLESIPDGTEHDVTLVALAAALETVGLHLSCCTAAASHVAFNVALRLSQAAQDAAPGGHVH